MMTEVMVLLLGGLEGDRPWRNVEATRSEILLSEKARWKIYLGRVLCVECARVYWFCKARRSALPMSMGARPALRGPLLIASRRILLAIRGAQANLSGLHEAITPALHQTCQMPLNVLLSLILTCLIEDEGTQKTYLPETYLLGARGNLRDLAKIPTAFA
eukprot:1152725-Pelagomonas_calceolata.AAC.2